jgi:hypothetical protein
MGSPSDFERMLPACRVGRRRRSSSGWFANSTAIFRASTRPDVCVWLIEQARRLGAGRAGLAGCLPASARRGSGERLGLRALACRGNRTADPRERDRLENGPVPHEREYSVADRRGTAAAGHDVLTSLDAGKAIPPCRRTKSWPLRPGFWQAGATH